MTPDEIKQQFGDLVRKRRLAAGLSQEALGDLCGLHRTYISSLERGERNVSLENIFALAGALKCTARDLIPREK